MFSALSLATLLLACAHDTKNQRASERTTPAERAEARADADEQHAERRAEQTERRAEREAQREHRAEDVDVPRRRADRDRVASANGVPDRARADEASDANVSAFDQGNNEVDLDLTQRIRKAVMDDDSLSFKAKNVKIITRDGRVNLTGSVKTPAEKDAIYKCAVSAAGVGHVSNQIQVDGE
jgi:osmotically-inducible protein OsmY